MGRYITHEAISMGLFSLSYNTALGAFSQWDSVFQNNLELTTLLVERMATEYLSLQVKMRRPWGAKEVASH